MTDRSDRYDSSLELSSRTAGPFLTGSTTDLNTDESPFDSFTARGALGPSFLVIVEVQLKTSDRGLSKPSYLLIVEGRLTRVSTSESAGSLRYSGLVFLMNFNG